MTEPLLQIEDLHVSIGEKEILSGVSLKILPGQILALMGPNGSGKSTLSYALAGHPKYMVTSGAIFVNGKDITVLSADLRAKEGIFLSFQYPKSIPGVSISNFLRFAYNAVKQKEIRVFEFQKILKEKMEALQIPASFAKRSINEGFSGGEKKKFEMLQAMILEPKLIIMDETDSGLDIDALKIVADGAKKLLKPDTAILLITHYHRILNYLEPNMVSIMRNGNIVVSGGVELSKEIEKKGFKNFKEKKTKKRLSKKGSEPSEALPVLED